MLDVGIVWFYLTSNVSIYVYLVSIFTVVLMDSVKIFTLFTTNRKLIDKANIIPLN